MPSAYEKVTLSLTGLAYRYSDCPKSDSFLCGYVKIKNKMVRDKGDRAPPQHILLSYSEGTHYYRTLVGFNFYPPEKRFESDLEWIVRTKDINSQALRFEAVRLHPLEMLLKEKQFFTRVLMQLEKLSPALLHSPRPITSLLPAALRRTTAGYPENFRQLIQEKAPRGEAYSLPRFSIPTPPDSWGQSPPKSPRYWWERAPEFPEESSRVRTGRYG